MIDHPEGWLAFDHHPDQCTLRPFEDSTRAADAERSVDYCLTWFRRAATPTELVLLAAVGYVVPPTGTDTVVTLLTPGIRRRTWPDLAAPTTTQDGAGQ